MRPPIIEDIKSSASIPLFPRALIIGFLAMIVDATWKLYLLTPSALPTRAILELKKSLSRRTLYAEWQIFRRKSRNGVERKNDLLFMN